MSTPLTRLSVALSSIALALGVSATPALGDTTSLAGILGGDACDHAAPTPTAPQTAPVRIGTYNIRAGVSTSDFAAGVQALLPYVDIAGLQETNSKDKAQVLADLASSGWDFWRQYRTNISSQPLVGGTEQQPVLWRSDRFVCTYAGPAFMSSDFSLGGEKTPVYNGLVSRWFTVVHLVDRVTGQRIAILNTHQMPGCVMGGVPTPGIPRHVALFKKQLAKVVAKAQQQMGYGRVFVLGDFNAGWAADSRHRVKGLPFRQFRSIGFTSMWATEMPTNGRGTHLASLIDQVWSNRKATSARVLFALKYSDHYPAVAQYSLPAVPLGG